MPELPDITVYLEALEERIVGQRLCRIRVFNPFLLRTAEPTLESLERARVTELARLGKRIAIGLDTGPWLVMHLMIAGRLHWSDEAPQRPTRNTAAALEFESGTLLVTEAGTKKRASLHVAADRTGLADFDRGGLEVLDCDTATFKAAMTRRNHTLKRALTDPTILSGIGNAYSDEILHRARLSPVRLTARLADEEWKRLHEAARATLEEWIERLRDQSQGRFPEKVTAFRPEMRVHGRYGKACLVCGTAVQRIRYASNETDYCPRCQTEGKLLTDRSLSRLLKDDWPRSIEELEQRRGLR